MTSAGRRHLRLRRRIRQVCRQASATCMFSSAHHINARALAEQPPSGCMCQRRRSCCMMQLIDRLHDMQIAHCAAAHLLLLPLVVCPLQPAPVVDPVGPAGEQALRRRLKRAAQPRRQFEACGATTQTRYFYVFLIRAGSTREPAQLTSFHRLAPTAEPTTASRPARTAQPTPASSAAATRLFQLLSREGVEGVGALGAQRGVQQRGDGHKQRAVRLLRQRRAGGQEKVAHRGVGWAETSTQNKLEVPRGWAQAAYSSCARGGAGVRKRSPKRG